MEKGKDHHFFAIRFLNGENDKNWTFYIMAISLAAGSLIAFANDDWNVLFLAGCAPVALFLMIRNQVGNHSALQYLSSSVIGALGSMILVQARGVTTLQFIVVALMIALVLFRNWKVYIPFGIILSLTITGLWVAQNNGSETYRLTTFSEAGFVTAIVYVALVALLAVFFGFLAELILFLTRTVSEYRHLLDQRREYEETNVEFAKQIASGNFENKYNVREGDRLGESLIEMSKSLRNAAMEERQRNWMVEGITEIADILRGNHANMEELANSVIAHVVKYMKANQGGIFIVTDDGSDPYLELKGCYAFDRRKYHQKKILAGEGLAGQAYLEKEMIYMTDIPADYIQITSGLGDANPNALIIAPLKVEEQVVGIIELASFTEFQEYEREYLQKVSENIASAIISSKVKDQTNKLLRESQELTQQMRAQEEEMRQNMEELQATQDHLQRESREREKIQKENEQARNFLQKIINAIPDPIYVKERTDHRFIMVNQAWIDIYSDGKDVIGKNDYDLFTREIAEKSYGEEEKLFSEKSELLIQRKGKKKGKEIWNLTRKQVIEDEHGQRFLIGINTEITDLKKAEEALIKEKYLFDALMKGVSESIYFKDRDSRFIRVNDKMLKAFKANSQEELTGKTDFDFFTEEHARPAFEAEQEIIRTGNPILNVIEKETWEDGSITYVSTSKLPLRDLEGNIVGTYGISHDVTELQLARENKAKKGRSGKGRD